MPEEVKPAAAETKPAEAAPTPPTPATPPPAAATPSDPAAAKPADAVDPAKPGEAKPEEKKPADAKPGAPEKYDFKLPEKSVLSAEHLKNVEAYAKENGLSQEQAQKVLERDNSMLSDYVKTLTEANHQGGAEWTKRVEAYEAQIMADKEIGGEHAKENIGLASRVLKHYGDEQFVKDLDTTGFGSHPGLVKVFAKIGKAMGEDKFVSGSPAESVQKSHAETLYPSMKK